MSCGAMPSQLGASPGGLEQCSQTDTEKEGNCLWPGKPAYSLGQARLMEKMGEGQGERDGERGQKGMRWQTDVHVGVDGSGKQM